MNLIVCGDSWSNGAELQPEEQNFGQLLSQKLNANLYNQSVDASSIPHLIIQLKKAVAHCDLTLPTKALFFLTASDRDLIWSQQLPKGSGFSKTHPPPHSALEEIFLAPSDPLHEHWYKTYHSRGLSNFRCNTSLITLQAMCKYHSIQDYYIWGWEKFCLWPEVDKTKFYNNAKSRIFDFFTDDPKLTPCEQFNKNSRYFWPNGGHPNQLGHRVIADNLHNWIGNVH
jgi:hypothetical protein